jgi:hypothetical protein
VLLSTALFAERREIVKPKRAAPLDPAQPSTVKKRSDDRTPFTSTRPKSAELRSRCPRVKRAVELCAPRAGSASGRETGSTFRAPALDNFLSTARRHASSETVRAFAAQVAGLVGSFHGSRHPATEKDQQKQIDGEQSERGTLRAAGRPVNTREAGARARHVNERPNVNDNARTLLYESDAWHESTITCNAFELMTRACG